MSVKSSQITSRQTGGSVAQQAYNQANTGGIRHLNCKSIPTRNQDILKNEANQHENGLDAYFMDVPLLVK